MIQLLSSFFFHIDGIFMSAPISLNFASDYTMNIDSHTIRGAKYLCLSRKVTTRADLKSVIKAVGTSLSDRAGKDQGWKENTVTKI